MARVRVEDCLCLDVTLLTRGKTMLPGFGGTYYFIKDDKEIDNICWVLMDDCVCFECTGVKDGSLVGYSYWVLVTYTPTQFGGRRAWFHCPSCDARVCKLFRPPGANTDFKCRECHGLTYASQQRQSNRLMNALDRFIDSGEFDRMRREPWIADLEEDELLRAYLEAEQRPLPDLASILEPGELFAKPRRGRPKVKRPYHRARPFAKGKRKNHSERLCMRCRDWREVENPQPVTLPNGRPALKGRCPVCQAKMTAIIKGR